MASDDKQTSGLPNGFGFTRETVKHRTDEQTSETVKNRTDEQTSETVKHRTDEQTSETVKHRTDEQTSETVEHRSDEQTSEIVKHRTDDQTSESVKHRTDDQNQPCCTNATEINNRVGDNCTSYNSGEDLKRTCSIEIDTLRAHRVMDQTFTPDHQIPQDYIDCKPSKQPSAPSGILFKTNPKPAQSSEILIPHKDQTDTVLGDFFGATLCTFPRKSDTSVKYQHILKDIKEGFPAKAMRIGESDELVLIGDTFTPVQDHDAVLNTFKSGVKVDGTSRFALVLRRSETKGGQTSWYWYETSAILAPDHKGHRSPDVLQPHCAAVVGKRIVQQIVYAIPSNSSLYMFIDETGIRAVPIEKDDHSVYVNKIIQFSFTTKGYTSQKGLCGKDNKSYVRIEDQRNICIREEPTWFDKGKHVGDDDSFETNGYYLVFDIISQTFAMVATCDNPQTVQPFRGYRLNTRLDSTDDARALRTTSYSEHGNSSFFSSPVNNARTHHDVVPQSPICLSADDLEIDLSIIVVEDIDEEEEEEEVDHEIEEKTTG